MSKQCITHFACDCICEKLNKQKEALSNIKQICDEIWKKCFDREGDTRPNYVVYKLEEIYIFLKSVGIE